VDYRVGYAPFDGNDEYLVYPHSVQEIGAGQQLDRVKVVSFDSLVCVGTRDGIRKWQHYVSEFYSEPLLVGSRVYIGTYAGQLICVEAATGNRCWTVETGSPINGKATVANGQVIVSNGAGSIMAFDAESGQRRWATQLPVEERAFQSFSRAVVGNNAVYVGSADKNLYCLDLRTGHRTWHLTLDDWVRSAPVLQGNTVVVATVGGRVYGIDAGKNPAIRWQQPVSDHGIYADLRVYRGAVYAASSDFHLASLNPETGAVRWKTSIFESVPDPTHDRILADLVGGGPDYQSGTTIADGVAYVGSPRFVYAIDVASGRERWKFETRGQICGAPAVAGGQVFFGQQGGTDQFYCVDAKTGRLVWKKPLGWVWASPNVKAGKVYVASVAGTFFCLDQQTGNVLWQYASHQGAYPAPALWQNRVYFGAWNGNYYAFDKDTGKLIWQHDIKGHPDSGAALVIDSLLYAQGFAAPDFSALNALTGQERWKFPLNGEWCNASPTANGQVVLFSTYVAWLHQAPFPAHTYCVDAKTGKLLYKLPFAGGLTGATLAGNLVFTASTTDSYMRAWDVATGTIRWQYRMSGRAEETCTSIYGDKALVFCTDGYLYAFE
jgi:outer membrane protein assembly factor BamB